MPNRILKESVCTSVSIDELTWFEEVVFYRLIVNCDDYGLFDGRLQIIKGRLFPLKDGITLKTLEKAIDKLVSVGLVALYEYEGQPYLRLPTWSRHQRIRAKKSKYPRPDGETQPEEIICCQVPSDDNKCPRNPIQSESNPNPNPNPMRETTRARDSAAVAAYLSKINPSASPVSIDELKGYVAQMGDEVCIRAMDIALDAKKATWPYIRGILRKWQGMGVTCLADIAEKEAEHGHHGTDPTGNSGRTWALDETVL